MKNKRRRSKKDIIDLTKVKPHPPPERTKERALPAGPWAGIIVVCKRGRATVNAENGWTPEKTKEFMDRTFTQDAPHRVFWADERRKA